MTTFTLPNVYISQSRPKVYLTLEEFLNHPANYTLCSTIQYQVKVGSMKGEWRAVIKTKDNQQIVKTMSHKKANDYFGLELHGVSGTVQIDFYRNQELAFTTSRPIKVVCRNDLGSVPEGWIQEKKTDLPRGKAAWKKDALLQQKKHVGARPSLDVSAALELVKCPHPCCTSTDQQSDCEPIVQGVMDECTCHEQPTTDITPELIHAQGASDVQLLLAHQMYAELCYYKALSLQLQSQVTDLQIQLVEATSMKRKREEESDQLDDCEPCTKYLRCDHDPSNFFFDF